MKTINVVNIKENWIMDKIADEICSVKAENFKIIISEVANNEADINYWVNWKTFKPDYNKTKFDMMFFTHFDGRDWEDKILEKADIVVCMSEHGKIELLKHNIPERKIKVCPYFGILIKEQKKIKIGIAGRIYHTERKGELELLELAKNLGTDYFDFIFNSADWNEQILKLEKLGFNPQLKEGINFYKDIDYYLQISTAEGGSMDMLNAIYYGLPIISRDIGFFYTYKSYGDYCYKSLIELINIFYKISIVIKRKRKIVKNQTWNNFQNFHYKLFKEVLNELANHSGNKIV